MEEIKTGVDELMELVRHAQRISIPDAAKKLKVKEKTLQNWVDFLVEEKLLGIEYKFTTPFIYLNTQGAAKVVGEEQTIMLIRNVFVARAREKGIPANKISLLWRNHLLEAVERKKQYFEQEAHRRKLDEPMLFEVYKERILTEYELGPAA